MKAKEFNELLEKHRSNPQELIRMHCNRKIYLSSYQFDKVVRIRDGKRIRYEKSISNDTSDSILHRIQDNIRNAIRIEKLQERIQLYLSKWR